MFLLAKVSYKLKLVDLPDERKVHSKPVAYTGGIIISIILFLSILFFDISNSYLIFILLMALIISIFGLIDDKYHINATSKLCLQIIPILYLIFFHNLSLDHLGNYNYINLNTGILGVPITLICVLFLINSFNYFDGLDGTLGFSSLSTIFILIYNILYFNPILGYDAEAHYAYINYLSRYLPRDFRLPTVNETREFFNPPVGYLVPSIAQVICRNVIESSDFLSDCQPYYGKVTQVFQSFMYIITIYSKIY